jgi:hypothetical protein
MRAIGLLVLLPLAAHAQQTITVPCMQNLQNGRVLFGNLTLPVLPEHHRWTLLLYEPTQPVSDGMWRNGQCIVGEIAR